MKKTVSFLAVLLFMIVGYPVLVIYGWVSGFSVIVRYPAVTFAGLTVLFLALSLPLLTNKEKTVNTVTAILSAIIVPLSVVNLLVCVWENCSFAVLLMTLVWVIVSFLLMYRCGKNGILTGVLTGFSVLLLVIVLFLMVILLFFTIGQNTVVQTLPSPNGTYYAEVIDSDQGALGGDTLVEVYDTRKQLDLFLITVQKNPQRVYFGDWGDFKTMTLQWESEQVLRINGKPNIIE